MKTGFTLLFIFVFLGTTWSQERIISGNVSSLEDGQPLAFVNVVLKGTTVGTITDIKGNYSLTAPESGGILVFSFVGLVTQEVTIGSQSVIDIQQIQDITQLSEIVITALGIEREARSLGYSVDDIGSEDLNKARSPNILDALQGKVSGVFVQRTGGNLGGSSKIIIRGMTSLSGRNAPLWVVDGIPINDNQFAVGNDFRGLGYRDFGNGASVLNSDDIETISILKGAAATALYGSRAAAGAIIVTSKRGSKSQGGVKVTLNSSYRMDNLFVIPDYQQDFGMGSLQKYDSSAQGYDWGPRLVGQTVPHLPVTGESGILQPIEDNGVKEFFKTGHTFINNFSVSDGNESMDYRLSFGATNQTGIVPGSDLDRYNVSLNTGLRHNSKLESRFGVQFIKTDSRGTAASGANDPNVIGLSSFSSTLDPKVFEPWIDENGDQINQLTPTSNNPYWIRFENHNDRDDTRLLANASLRYSPIEKLSFTAKFGYDYDQDNRFLSNRKGTAQRLEGDYTVQNINSRQTNVDIIGTYGTSLSENFSLNLLGGFNYNNRLITSESLFGNQLLVAELFDPGNVKQSVPSRGFSEQVLFGAYGSVDIGFRDYLTLNLTGRNDWSSTLPLENNSYFYPSVSLAFVFTDAIPGLGGNEGFNYGKLRASYAEVGNDTGPYQLDFSFFPVTTASGQYGLNVNFPFNGRQAFSKGNIIPPQDLKPERQKSFEIGTELDFFDSRLGLDISYFSTQNNDQILALPIPESTGFASFRTNVGQVNTSGIEISLNAVPLRFQGFTWSTLIIFSQAKVKVVELTEGLDQVVIAGAFNSVGVVAELDGGFELIAIPFLRDSISGRPIINPATGTRLAGEAKTFGSVLPDFTMGFVNTFTYRNLSLSFTIDWRSGGVMKSSTVEALQSRGLVEETLVNRGGTFIDAEGVLENPDGTFRDNDIPVRSAEWWWNLLGSEAVAESAIFDASFVKLREVAINYTLPASLLGNSFLNGASIGIEARSLALLYSKVPHIDPESNLLGSGVDGFGIERASTPSTRSIGINLKLQF